jgi:hypothetical protein
MTVLGRKRRQRTIAAFCSGVLGLALLPLLGFLAVDALRSSKEGKNALDSLPPLVSIPSTPGSMLAVADAQGKISSIVVIALKPAKDGEVRGGTVIVVPAGVRTYLDDGSVVRLADMYDTGGVDALKAAVEGALSVALVRGDVVDELRLTELFAPARLTAPVYSGSDEVIPAGEITLDPATLAKALAAPLGERELERLAAAGDLWSAVVTRIGPGIGAPVIGDPTTSLDGFVTSLYAGKAGAYRLSATQLDSKEENPLGSDMLKLNVAEATLVTATVLPSSVSPPYATVTFYVRSPLGDPRYTLEAVSRLLFKNANVVLVKEDSGLTIPERNTISFLNEATGEQAKLFAESLGSYEVVPIDKRIDGVDVILTLGSEFLADADLDRTNAPTTVPGDDPFATDPTTPDPDVDTDTTEEG